MTPRALLLDIDGTLVDGGTGPEGRALPGAVDAVRRLTGRFPHRYVSNTTSKTRRVVTDSLAAHGFPAEERDVFTPASLARRVLTSRGHARGVLVAPDGDASDLDWFERAPPGRAAAVLVADEAHAKRVIDLLPAVEALHAGARLYTLQQNRYYRREGRLLPDLGPLVAYLAYAADTGWEAFGKPSPLLFEAVADELGVAVDELALVGDDAEFDVAGALAAGVGTGILVRTGKYRAGDEERVSPPPSLVIDSIAELPGRLAAAAGD